ncbi:AAA family ATPase [Bacillus mycoides]|uniref:AAA family ATPase n=1 Tax=Bacillus mycoides TaxID=1405 RepID=UPI0037FC9F92
MIEKINVESFGMFKDFKWTRNVSSLLGTFNIIYGRNYSGKTTLSRIFRSLEQKKLHTDFEDGKFSVELSDKRFLSHIQLASSDIKLRVYNYDFKTENLSFLSNKEGEIIPFAILGEKNVETERKISEANTELQSNKLKLNGSNDHIGIISKCGTLKKELEDLERSLDEKLRERARNIKRDSTLFKIGVKSDYNIRDIKAELGLAEELSVDESNRMQKTLVEEQKNSLVEINQPVFKLEDYIEASNELLRKSISPSQSIKELLDNSDLQNWVREGIDHHEGKRDRCAFCDSELTTFLWEKLGAHFTKEAESHKTEINKLVKQMEVHKDEIENIVSNHKNDFYIEFQSGYQNLINEWNALKSKYLSDLDYILNLLRLRSNSIYNEYSLDKSALNNPQKLLGSCIVELNKIIKQNNEYSNSIADKKEEAVRKLRLNNIKNFIDEIRYDEELKRIEHQRELWKNQTEELKTVGKIIQELESNITYLRTLLNDELKAAEKVNEYLRVSLGHPELTLEVEKVGSKSTFVIKREGDIAYNLSEGEQTLISFSYFLAQLKDIPASDKAEYIIFIDDPICSLDSSNIFSIFSLIDSEINQDNYKQIFISTHNMDFLKYLRRASRKKNYFMIERLLTDKSNANSKLVDMPKYMQGYVTEFVFLFEQIYRVANEVQGDENYHVFYNFPNNARKFLESYLFFKYPDIKIKNDDRINMFFGSSSQQVAFMQRINNEYSHGEEQFDRLSKPIDIPEFQKDALLILDTIQKKDIEQYNALCKSIIK